MIPLKASTTSLQASSADVSLAIKSIHFLRRLSISQPALSNHIQQVLSKWVNSNAVANAIIINSGVFYDAVKQYVASQTTIQDPSGDHYNDERGDLTFAEIVYEQIELSFQVINPLSNLRPTSADVERMFSLGRLS